MDDRFDENKQVQNEKYTGGWQEENASSMAPPGQGETEGDSNAAEDHSHFGTQPQWQPPEPQAPPASQEWQAAKTQGSTYGNGPEQPGYSYG